MPRQYDDDLVQPFRLTRLDDPFLDSLAPPPRPKRHPYRKATGGCLSVLGWIAVASLFVAVLLAAVVAFVH